MVFVLIKGIYPGFAYSYFPDIGCTHGGNLSRVMVVLQAVTSLGRGIVHGVAGVVAQPIMGAHSGGVSGFFSGKLLSGIVTWVSNFAEGILMLAVSRSAMCTFSKCLLRYKCAVAVRA